MVEGRCMACGVVDVKRVKASDAGLRDIFLANAFIDEVTTLESGWEK